MCSSLCTLLKGVAMPYKYWPHVFRHTLVIERCDTPKNKEVNPAEAIQGDKPLGVHLRVGMQSMG